MQIRCIQILAHEIDTDENSKAKLVRSNDPNVEKWGNYFGKIEMNNTDSIYFGLTMFQTRLPVGKDVFLEMDYLNTNSLLTSVVSIFPNTVQDDINIMLNPRENPEWRHIYIDLREIIGVRQNATVHEMGFSALLDELGTEKYIYLDNIKIIYQE
jgi:hypothetical protein